MKKYISDYFRKGECGLAQMETGYHVGKHIFLKEKVVVYGLGGQIQKWVTHK